MNDSPPARPDFQPLGRRGRLGLAYLAFVLFVFGVVTEYRSAFLTNRRTDFGCYARAGWAVRTGADPYSVTDNNGWHYAYTPAFAVAMLPFADPPKGLSTAGYVPYAVSVGVWYVASVMALMYACHAFATAVLPHLPRGSRGWWAARVGPALVAVAGLGLTLGRGQVNLYVVAAWAAAFAALVNGKRMTSGVWLGVATIIKFIPGLMFAYPFFRRDVKGILGGLIAAVVFVGIVPSLIWGVNGAVEMNLRPLAQILGPFVLGGTGRADVRDTELINALSTSGQSIQYVVHNWRHPVEATRPPDYEPISKRIHWACSFVLLGVTGLAIHRTRHADAGRRLVAFGALAVVMMLTSPVSHLHYQAFALPLVAGLWLTAVSERPGRMMPGGTPFFVLALWGLMIGTSMMPIPVWKGLRPFGTCTAATLLLWGYGVTYLLMGSRHNAGERLPHPGTNAHPRTWVGMPFRPSASSHEPRN
jgi:hypothetical protein